MYAISYVYLYRRLPSRVTCRMCVGADLLFPFSTSAARTCLVLWTAWTSCWTTETIRLCCVCSERIWFSENKTNTRLNLSSEHRSQPTQPPVWPTVIYRVATGVQNNNVIDHLPKPGLVALEKTNVHFSNSTTVLLLRVSCRTIRYDRLYFWKIKTIHR